MNPNADALFQAFLNQHDDRAWASALTALSPHVHEVDRAATEIWFAFFPLALTRALEEATDPEQLAADLLLAGTYRLNDQIDGSHRFLYGHRFWPRVKSAIEEHATLTHAPSSLELSDQIREVARKVAGNLRLDESLLVGITAVGFMTLQQVGLEAFRASPGAINVRRGVFRRSPARMIRARARDDSQGLFGFLRGEAKIYTVTFNENDRAAKFKLINTQHLTTAAANDKRDYHSRDPRCTVREGPIPVQCRAASCGSCWVGVLGGAEKLSEIAPLESRAIKEFGYIDTREPKPIIRLACQAQAFGAVSIVIPPWNGVFGKFLRRRQKPSVEAQKAP